MFEYQTAFIKSGLSFLKVGVLWDVFGLEVLTKKPRWIVGFVGIHYQP